MGAAAAGDVTRSNVFGAAAAAGEDGADEATASVCISGALGISFFISAFADFTSGEIFKASSSRTESPIIVPQLGQTDKLEAKILLQPGQFIVLKYL